MSESVAAQFRASGILKLQSRPGIFVCGELIVGAVRPGMVIEWPTHAENITTSNSSSVSSWRSEWSFAFGNLRLIEREFAERRDA
jgi:hypothetical protein